jgi:hypothetical protein
MSALIASRIKLEMSASTMLVSDMNRGSAIK